MNLHKHQLYLFEHSESFKIWSAIIRINTEGKSLIMKLGPGEFGVPKLKYSMRSVLPLVSLSISVRYQCEISV